MSNYKYGNPIDKGFTQFKLSRKQHNQLFKNRQIKWYQKYEYYYDKNYVKLHCFTNWKGLLAAIISVPLQLLYYGLSNVKELNEEIKELCNQKKYGAFTSDYIPSEGETYGKIMEIINNKK